MGLQLPSRLTLGKANDLAFQIPPGEPQNFLAFCQPHTSTARSAVMAATSLLQGGLDLGVQSWRSDRAGSGSSTRTSPSTFVFHHCSLNWSHGYCW